MRLIQNSKSHAKKEQLMLIGIPIYEKVDLLDVEAPYEIFNWMKESVQSVEVYLIAEKPGETLRPAAVSP
jgi:hypothetical protein